MTREPYDTNHLGYGISHHATPDGMSAHVRVGGRTVKRFKGETAHMDAQRHAMDLWSKANVENDGFFTGRY